MTPSHKILAESLRGLGDPRPSALRARREDRQREAPAARPKPLVAVLLAAAAWALLLGLGWIIASL
jgi:hypothetical protein